MRLSSDESGDEELAGATIAAAAEAGVTVFDTARSYGLGAADALAPWVARLAAAVSGPVQSALANDFEPSRSILIGASPAHRTLATALGVRYVPLP